MEMSINGAPALQEVEVNGIALFRNFIQEELVHEGLPEDAIIVENPPLDGLEDGGVEAQDEVAFAFDDTLLSVPDGFTNERLRKIGQQLREIADEFAVSRERALIREQADQYVRRIGADFRRMADQFEDDRYQRSLIGEPAEQVNLGSITESSFRQMLEEVFRNGTDRSRIIALFYFCSDVIISCIKKALYLLGKNLFYWALNFLVTNVCEWVNEHGGWESIFGNSTNFNTMAYAAVAIGVIMISIIFYFRYTLYYS